MMEDNGMIHRKEISSSKRKTSYILSKKSSLYVAFSTNYEEIKTLPTKILTAEIQLFVAAS